MSHLKKKHMQLKKWFATKLENSKIFSILCPTFICYFFVIGDCVYIKGKKTTI